MAEENSELARIYIEIKAEEDELRAQQQQEQQHVVVKNFNFRDKLNLLIAGVKAFIDS